MHLLFYYFDKAEPAWRFVNRINSVGFLTDKIPEKYMDGFVVHVWMREAKDKMKIDSVANRLGGVHYYTEMRMNRLLARKGYPVMTEEGEE